jgi:uncharacterized protein (DUF433 family)
VLTREPEHDGYSASLEPSARERRKRQARTGIVVKSDERSKVGEIATALVQIVSASVDGAAKSGLSRSGSSADSADCFEASACQAAARAASRIKFGYHASVTYRDRVIHSDPEILGGTPVFVGTRVPFQALLDYIEGGHPLADFLDDFPSVSREKAVTALEQAKELLVAHSAR